MSKRRLAAIMFTDIVGYASLLKEDEKKAFETLRKNQRIHRRLIKKFKGRWLKEMGGGILASFHSNIDAVMCALSIQKATTDLEIPLRIGIHLGDVIFERKDVLGDGVNIASRIQSLIETNGIVISETVYNDIKNKDGLDVESLGERPLKGVKKPVEIYTVTCQDDSLLDYSIDTGELVRPFSFGRSTIVAGIMVIALLAFALYFFLPKIINPPSEIGKSVLVLPFDNYTGTDTLDYFVAGMHNSLIGGIGKISALQVKSKTTANAYNDTEKSLIEIAEELGVNTFIEGSVLCLGDSVCLQVKLMSTYPEEKQIWIQDFKVEKSQILNLYNTVTKEISNEINVILTPEEERLLAKSRTVDLEAYDAYLKGHQYLDDISLESLNKAKEYLNIAIEKDPDWVPLYSGLATVWMSLAQNSLESPSVAYQKAYEYLNKALELDPDHTDTHFLIAHIAWLNEWDWAKAEREFLKAIAGNPSNAWSRMWYAHLLCILHRSDEALTQAQLASDLDPLNPFLQTMFSMVLLNTGDCETAMAHVEKVLAIDPENFIANMVLGVVAFHCGDYNKVIETEKYLLKGYSRGQFEEDAYKEIERIFDEQGFSAAYEEVLHQWEVLADNGFVGPIDMAVLYMRGNRQDKAMDLIEKGFELRDPNMPYLATKSYTLDSLYDNPRFIAILEKLNLPLP